MLSYRLPLGVLAFLVMFFGMRSAQAQPIDDVMVRYSRMVITKTRPDFILQKGTLLRHNIEVVLGRGPFSVGLTYQKTDRRDTQMGTPEQGVMLTAGYDHLLSYYLRLESFGRLGLSNAVDFANPLYATDTDFRINLVAFHPDGMGFIAGKPVFPSGYVGGITNQFGRVQGITGAGLWWNHLNVYLTLFYAFNGVEDPRFPGQHADKTAAFLDNGGVTTSLSYQIGDFLVEARRNVPLKNGGNDLTLVLQYRFFFDSDH